MDWRVCALDGPGGSGKSTLALQMAIDLDAIVIPMESFHLPKPKHKISAIAKNVDLDRFLEEVIYPLEQGKNLSYRVMDLVSGEYRPERVLVPSHKKVIIEGTYSMELSFRQAYDFTIFVDCQKQELLKRAVALDGQDSSMTWLDKWLPGEETYLLAQGPLLAATLIVDGSTPFPTTSHLMELVQLRLEQENKSL